jgi:hypothetical protein
MYVSREFLYLWPIHIPVKLPTDAKHNISQKVAGSTPDGVTGNFH